MGEGWSLLDDLQRQERAREFTVGLQTERVTKSTVHRLTKRVFKPTLNIYFGA